MNRRKNHVPAKGVYVGRKNSNLRGKRKDQFKPRWERPGIKNQHDKVTKKSERKRKSEGG